jgi:hypothetical protein
VFELSDKTSNLLNLSLAIPYMINRVVSIIGINKIEIHHINNESLFHVLPDKPP